MSAHFWEHKRLDEMSAAEWESLCDGCGKCCLVKLEDEESGEVVFTNVACDLLNLKSCQCGNYENRFRLMPDCLQLTLDKIAEFHWLPITCAYRRLAEGDPLPEWHPLLTGSRSAMHAAGQSIRNKVIHERHAGEWEEHIVTWPLGF
ncbi:YcgN family cysteine cluster protein [Pseudaeromonas sharmana]|uniref:UPF0260 protein ACFOSS_11605 n=1 Tax=Pseudaeromonas sharmana TaxID=328412 RepID=A0ABV8CPT8_9GAMM